jgi:hypothetical protein
MCSINQIESHRNFIETIESQNTNEQDVINLKNLKV